MFSVPKGKEDEFVKWWQDVKTSITKQQGFISGKFHRSVWEGEDLYWKAYEKSATPMKAKLDQLGVEMTPVLYTVAFDY